MKEEIKTLKAENAELKANKKKAEANAKLSAAGFKAKADGDGFEGLSDSTYQVLLAADDHAFTAILSDLKPSQTPEAKPQAPSVLLSEQANTNTPSNTAVQLSASMGKSSLTGGDYV